MEPLLRLAGPDDAESMARLFYETVHEVNSRDYPPEQIAAWAPRLLTPEQWRSRQAGKIVYVAAVADGIAGFAELEATGHVDCFYCRKDRQNQGVGSRLLGALEATARDLGIRRLFADVSITARPFFERRGFRLLRAQDVDRGGVILRNYVMEKVMDPANPSPGDERRASSHPE